MESTDSKKFYVYEYLRANDSENGQAGTPYYIGKGTGRRAWTKGHAEVQPSRDASLIRLIATDMSEPDAFQAEMLLVYLHGRIDLGTGCLRNKTDGGDGVSGHVHSREVIERIAAKKRGVKQRPESIAKRSETNRGSKRSEETRKRMSERKRGASHPMFGRHRSAEANARHSATVKGRPSKRRGKTVSEETRIKMSAAQLGKKRTPEQNAATAARMIGNKHGIGAIHIKKPKHISNQYPLPIAA